MGRTWVGLAGLVLALGASGVLADEFPVVGNGAAGKPGERVYVDLTYDYGSSFSAIAEDLDIAYSVPGLTMVPGASTIDMFGTTRTLHDYATLLQQFASGHFGNVLENPAPTLGAGIAGYALSYFTADDVGQPRNGKVHLSIAFDIASNASPGSRFNVSFANSVIVDQAGNEFSYPAALQNLSVNVVPEPAIAWMLLPGVVVVAARARTSRRQDS